ncbi:uncharacterized protein LOC126734485 [Anthonomus grandis grandis]|uniref:uncharacterized protein LOC126734485 n=1 Tax=Anthonomus grandis grandis TaxID=2921223 RepID=UPI002165652E|nr:uncharacterized protein LOC126734485 [Anthonomus grandis grandis]
MAEQSLNNHEGAASETPEAATLSEASYEEGHFIDYTMFEPKKYYAASTKSKNAYFYQDYPYVKPTQSDFDRKEVTGSKLFEKTKKVVTIDSTVKDEPSRDASILISGFGMRNVASFQQLIKMSHEERRKWELKKLWRDEHGKTRRSKEEEELLLASARSTKTETSTSTDSRSRTSKTSSDSLTQTDATIRKNRPELKHLDYLLGLETEVEEEPKPFPEIEEEGATDYFKYSSKKSVKEAQKYLRIHRIFECFQFIIAHMLSANAENPIEFILNLLNKCILYRSGLGNPPLLYEKKHINKLFDLMDRMGSGYIEICQYVTGMKTLGICTFNEDPDLNDEGLVTRETFVEEAYEAQVAIFEELIKKRPEKNKQKFRKAPGILDSVSVPSLNPPYFIPSDLFKFSKHQLNSSTSSQHENFEGE